MVSPPTKEFLEEVYVRNSLSTWAIEKKFGFSRSMVYALLKRYDIAPRNLAQSHIRYARTDFSGDLCEKAYLIGFSIGDLRVRKHNGARSSTISIGCGSTKPAQIALVSGLFSKYGRVWEGKPDKRGAINIEAFVNDTFGFLLPQERDYHWCLKQKKHFFSFLAGFTDAEGSFYISNKKAFISWGNYDTNLLKFIKHGLARFGIAMPRIYTDSLKGLVGSHGYPRNNNYSHLTCVRKEMVGKLLKELGPRILHRDKMVAMAHLRKNLIMRGVHV